MLADRVRMGTGGGMELGPGPQKLFAGTMKEGYFGETSYTELISGDALASQLQFSSGYSQNSTAGWLKYIRKGRIIFVAKRSFRYAIRFNRLIAAGLVYGDGSSGGDATTTIDGLLYIVRLLRGLNDDYDPKFTPAGNNGVHCHGSEWNRLILPVHINAKTKSWGSSVANVEADLPYWGADFSGYDLGQNIAMGSRSWTQNEYGAGQSVFRGGQNLNIANSSEASQNEENSLYGWRPALELIP